MIKVSFPDSNVKEFKKGTKVIDIAKSISEGLARKVISASYNSVIVELSYELNENGDIKFLTGMTMKERKLFGIPLRIY